MPRILQQVLTPLNAVTATTSSQAIPLAGVRKATWFFTRANHSSGSTAFSVDVSADGTTWVAYARLIDNVTNTNAQNLTRVSSKSLSSNTTVTLSMDLANDAFAYCRVTATETTDGTHTAKLILEYF